jgi:hypothetical protein
MRAPRPTVTGPGTEWNGTGGRSARLAESCGIRRTWQTSTVVFQPVVHRVRYAVVFTQSGVHSMGKYHNRNPGPRIFDTLNLIQIRTISGLLRVADARSVQFTRLCHALFEQLVQYVILTMLAETELARRPVCPLPLFRFGHYKKDSGEVRYFRRCRVRSFIADGWAI